MLRDEGEEEELDVGHIIVFAGERVTGKAVDVPAEDDSLHGGGKSEREFRSGEEIGGAVRRLQEVDDGDGVGEGDVRGEGS